LEHALHLLRIAVAYGALAILPGVLPWALFARRARPARGAFIALALGPVVSVVLLAAGFSLATPPSTCVLPLAIGLAVVSLLSLRRLRPSEPAQEEGGAATALPILAALVLVIAFLPLVNEWWRVRSDAWFHAAFAIEVRDFGIPPEDPFFAGLPLRYFWMFHLYLAALARLAGSSPFPFFVLINMQALAALVLGLHLLSSRFRKDAASNRFAVLMATLGLNALFWLFLPLKALRALVGSERGGAELTRIYDQFPIQLLPWIDFLSPLDGAQPFFLSKFIVGSAFSMGLALAALVLLAFVEAVRGDDGAIPPRAHAALAALGLSGIWAFHPDVALFLGPAIAGAVVLTRARRAIEPAVACVVVTALFAPYLMSVGGGSEVLGRLVAPDPRRALAIASVGVVFLALAALEARNLARSRDPAARLLLCAGALLAILAMMIRLPGSERAQTMDKNPYFLALGLALPAGWALADLLRRVEPLARRRSRTILVSALLFVPANAAMLFGYVMLPDRHEVPPQEQALHDWMRRASARDAVFLQSQRVDVHVRMRPPVLAPRRVFAGAPHLAREWGYPEEEITRRAALEESILASGGDSAPATSSLPVEGLGDLAATEVYFLRDLAAETASNGHASLSDPAFPLAYASDRYRVYTLRGNADRDHAASAR
jgi:hypothetical protein